MSMPSASAGLFDLQVNGFAGVDFNDAALAADALDHALAAMARTGVTACLPTLITAEEAVLADRLRALDRAVAGSRLGPLMVPGYHLEGPFLNPAPGFAGCHPPHAMVPPDPALLDRVRAVADRPVLLLTLAPEQPGTEGLITHARAQGIVIALGHTAASRSDIARACDLGASLSSHLGNALPRPAHKFDNPLIAQLAEDRLLASLIADGLHVPPHALGVMIRAKTPGRVILVTDATAAAGAATGTYTLGDLVIEHRADGTVRLPGTDTLAGSALCLDQAVRNLVAWGLASADQALAMAADIPRGLIRQPVPPDGTTAVWWDEALRPIRTIVGGMRISS